MKAPSPGSTPPHPFLLYLRLRAGVYRIISHFLLKEPTPETLSELVLFLRDQRVSRIVESLELCHNEAASLAAVSAKLTEELSSSPERLVDVWAEYTRLFIAPYPKAIPYESFWKGGGKGRLLFSASWEDVKLWYLEDGYALDDRTVAEDHLGVELEYVAAMSEEALEMLAEGRVDAALRKVKRSVDFLDAHVLKWATKMLKTVEVEAKEPFYRALASWTACFIKLDSEVTRKLVEELAKEADALAS
ncbi:MAG: molecular chaperone TorD family protein [Thermoproteota archaeon]